MFAESSSVISKPYWQRVKEIEECIAQERAVILAANNVDGSGESVEAALKSLNAKRTRLLRGIWWSLYRVVKKYSRGSSSAEMESSDIDFRTSRRSP